MESPSDIQGAEEELSSSESGWTMYIASPMEEDGDEEGEGEEHPELSWAREKNKYIRRDSSEEESDDSMASDASSGTAHHHHRQKKSGKKHKEEKWPFSKKRDEKDKKKGRAPKQ